MDFRLPKDYVKNNPNILEQVASDINKNFHYFFQGQVGSGKTYLADAIAKYHEFKIIKAREVYRDYLRLMNSDYSDKNEQLTKIVRILRGKNVIFDDIGAEKPKTAASANFIEDIIEDRYDWWKKGLAERTIFTTNLTGIELGELYGDRVVDRLQEMFIIMKFKKVSFRTKKQKIIEG